MVECSYLECSHLLFEDISQLGCNVIGNGFSIDGLELHLLSSKCIVVCLEMQNSMVRTFHSTAIVIWVS